MIQFIAEDYLPFFSKEVIAWCLDQASKDGNLPLVKYFLGRGKEKFVLSESHIGGMIINAAKENRVAVLQFLLYEMLIQPDMDFADSLTAAFEKASVKGHVAVLDLLLRKRADEAVPRTNFDPFQLHSMVMGVVRTGKPDILRYFFAKQLENDPRFQALDFAANDNEALLLACKNKDRLDIVKFFLCRDEASNEYVFPNIDPGAQENSALLFACERGLVEIVEELLRLDDNGAQVHSTVIPAAHDNEPLLLACQGGHTSIVELLLGGTLATDGTVNYFFADVDAAIFNNLPLWYAATGGHVDVVRLLLRRNEHGAYVHRNVAIPLGLPLFLFSLNRGNIVELFGEIQAQN